MKSSFIVPLALHTENSEPRFIRAMSPLTIKKMVREDQLSRSRVLIRELVYPIVGVHALNDFQRDFLPRPGLVHRLVFNLQRRDLLPEVGRVAEDVHGVTHADRVCEHDHRHVDMVIVVYHLTNTIAGHGCCLLPKAGGYRQRTCSPTAFSTLSALSVTHLLGCPFSSMSTHILPLRLCFSSQRPSGPRFESTRATASFKRGSRPQPASPSASIASNTSEVYESGKPNLNHSPLTRIV